MVLLRALGAEIHMVEQLSGSTSGGPGAPTQILEPLGEAEGATSHDKLATPLRPASVRDAGNMPI